MIRNRIVLMCSLTFHLHSSTSGDKRLKNHSDVCDSDGIRTFLWNRNKNTLLNFSFFNNLVLFYIQMKLQAWSQITTKTNVSKYFIIRWYYRADVFKIIAFLFFYCSQLSYLYLLLYYIIFREINYSWICI